MEFPPTYVSFTIPSGATTGARITINENGNGKIIVYDSDGFPVDEIGGNDGLIISKSSSQPGEVILEQGVIVIKNQGSTEQATLFVPTGSDPFGSLAIDSGFLGGGSTDESVGMIFTSGDSAFPVGNIDGMPHVYIWNRTQAPGAPIVPAYLGIAGGINKLNLTTLVPETWHAPSYTANFAGGSTFIAAQNLQYKLGTNDNLLLSGAFHALAAVSSATVFTLPVGFRPLANFATGIVREDSAGTTLGSNAVMFVQPSGTVFMRFNGATAVGENFYLPEISIPLGNVA